MLYFHGMNETQWFGFMACMRPDAVFHGMHEAQ
jgi:hypothetical protein